jgi:hypothetical protein
MKSPVAPGRQAGRVNAFGVGCMGIRSRNSPPSQGERQSVVKSLGQLLRLDCAQVKGPAIAVRRAFLGQSVVLGVNPDPQPNVPIEYELQLSRKKRSPKPAPGFSAPLGATRRAEQRTGTFISPRSLTGRTCSTCACTRLRRQRGAAKAANAHGKQTESYGGAGNSLGERVRRRRSF